MFDYSNLLGAMATKGITRSDMAKRLGLSKSHFCTVLKHGRAMSSDVMFRIAQILESDDYENLFFALDVKKS